MRKLVCVAALLGGSLLPIVTPAVAAVITRSHPAFHPRGRYHYRGRYYDHRYFYRGRWYYR